MKIAFIVPSWHYFHDPFKLQPYWEMYYATILSELIPSAKITFFDLRGKSKKENFEQALSFINEQEFYLYWIMKSGDASEVYSIVRFLRNKFPNAKHIAGGTHIDMLPEETEQIFDSIILGPGEINFKNAIFENSKSKRYFQNYKDVPFAKTPFPNRSFLPYNNVISNEIFSQYGKYNATMVYFSRGCFYNCSYCVYNVPSQLQSKDPQLIEKEIEYLKKNFHVNAILLKDEIALNPNKKIFQQQMEAIGRQNIIWRGQTTSIGTEEQLKTAKETGCLELSVGIETVDDNVMKIINKQWQSSAIIKKFIENSKKIGIKVKVCLILGLPGEPMDIVEKTIYFLEETKPDYVSLSGFCPLPGSPIFKNPEKYGISKIDRNWDNHAHLLYRFSDEEIVGIPFEYKKNTPWGNSFSRIEIIENIKKVQNWLDKRNMIY
jgi:radical SAM superfamily enzyme YgiQ (UPF0313 family)